tara:strand:+ start:49 stop:249 length:201 start_codon:yes stop_codon:yes gene_type:complete
VSLDGFAAPLRKSLDFIAVKPIAAAESRKQWVELCFWAISLREGLEDLTQANGEQRIHPEVSLMTQ